LGLPGIAQVFGFHIDGFPLGFEAGLSPGLWLRFHCAAGFRGATGCALLALFRIALFGVLVFGVPIFWKPVFGIPV
jgi:hypothetical protein